MDAKKYDKSSELQTSFHNRLIHGVENILIKYFSEESVRKTNSSSNFNFVDLGCATGKNTVNLFKILYRLYNENTSNTFSGISNPNSYFMLTFNDLSSNDFNITYQCFLQNMKMGRKDVFHQIALGSLYSSDTLPPNSADIISSNMAVHWMENENTDFFNETSVEPKYSSDVDYCEKIRKIAEENYFNFLKNAELWLKNNGLLILSDGLDYNIKRLKFSLCLKAWKDTISKFNIEKLLKYMTFKIYFRNREEFLKPITDRTVNFEVIRYEEIIDEVANYTTEFFMKFIDPLVSISLNNICTTFYEQEYGKPLSEELKEEITSFFYERLEAEYKESIKAGEMEKNAVGMGLVLRKL